MQLSPNSHLKLMPLAPKSDLMLTQLSCNSQLKYLSIYHQIIPQCSPNSHAIITQFSFNFQPTNFISPKLNIMRHLRICNLTKNGLGSLSSVATPQLWYHHRNGKVVRLTVLVFIGDVEACLQRLQWISGVSSWRPFRFSDLLTDTFLCCIVVEEAFSTFGGVAFVGACCVTSVTSYVAYWIIEKGT